MGLFDLKYDFITFLFFVWIHGFVFDSSFVGFYIGRVYSPLLKFTPIVYGKNG